MIAIAVTLCGLAAVVVVIVWLAVRRPETSHADTVVAGMMRAARRRSVVAVGFALVLLFAGFVVALAVPEWLGLTAAIAPAVAGAGGLALYAATPPPQDREVQTRYSASLQPRGPWNIASRTALASLGVGFLLLLGLLTFTGVTSTVDDRGLYRAITFTTGAYSSTSTPYPGWFYAVPLMVVTVLLVAAVWVALWRIATTASLPGAGLEDVDRLWRVKSAQIIVGIAFAAISLQLGAVAALAGATMGNAQFQPGVPVGWQVVATCLFVLGIVAMLVSIASLTLAVVRAFTLPGHAVSAQRSGQDGSARPSTVGGRA